MSYDSLDTTQSAVDRSFCNDFTHITQDVDDLDTLPPSVRFRIFLLLLGFWFAAADRRFFGDSSLWMLRTTHFLVIFRK
jgi:hypothetical protein